MLIININDNRTVNTLMLDDDDSNNAGCISCDNDD